MNIENKSKPNSLEEDKIMTGTIRITTINGITFEVWSDFMVRGTFAKNTQTGETKKIQGSGYIHKDLTVRKAIALVFQMPTFRK